MRVTATEIRTEIEQTLQEYVTAFTAAEEAIAKIAPFLKERIRMPFFYDAMSHAMSTVIERKLREVTTANRAHTLASIKIEELSPELTSFEGVFCTRVDRYNRRYSDLRSSACSDKVTAEGVLEQLRLKLQPEQLANEINALADGLVQKGLSEAAWTIQNKVSLEHFERHQGRFKATRRAIVMQKSDYGYSSTLADNWKEAADAIDVFTQEAKMPWASVGLRDYSRALREEGKAQIPAHTKFGEGTPLMLQKYKEHVLLHFQPDLFNALIAFLMLHSRKEISLDALDALSMAA